MVDNTLRLLACGIAIAGGLVLLFVIWSRQRGRGAMPGMVQRREVESATREQERLRGEIEKLMVELRGLSREIGEQLDSRQAGLSRVIAEADERIAELRSRVDVPVEGPTMSGREVEAAPNELARAVYELADRGMAVGEIARRVGRGAGEVELMLNLRSG